MDYCEKCNRCHEEGLRDDEECCYYGEPNGCNHPDYGFEELPENPNEVIIEFCGKRYVADDDTHTIEVGVDDTGAELVVEKMGMCLVVNLKEVSE